MQRGISMHFKPATRSVLIGLVLFLSLIQPAASQQRKPKAATAAKPAIAAGTKAALDAISADSMRGHLAFLASDLLEGRNTPSKGLDIAAEYIAAQFMRAGVQPGVEDNGRKSYFQVARWQVTEPNLDAFDLTIGDGAQSFQVPPQRISFQSEQTAELKAVPVIKVNIQDAAAISSLKPEQVQGKAVMVEFPEIPRGDRAQMMAAFRARNQITGQLSALKPAFVFSINRTTATGRGLGGGRLIDPERTGGGGMGMRGDTVMTVHDPRVVALFDAMQPGETKGTLSLKLGAPAAKPVELKNVIGIIPGTDPVLKDTYVLVSAHYDHVGVMAGMDGDNIFNGANDDGSGTVSVIELAAALNRLPEKPKRTLVFIAWFGEEKGLLGSRYYGRHPIFPLARTVAMVNLEQVGRTDSTEGPQINNATLTGFDFTDLGPIFKAAGELTGIVVYKHERNSDAYFGRSDNQALADAGIPAHTLCTAFEYPDYHQAGDHWDKVDYENMARVNRMVALALLNIANNPQAPKWNEANPKTARYVAAWKKLQGN